jgi:hypothetical protein
MDKLSMTSPVVPLASNDLFGGAHLGQHAERIQAAQPFKLRRQLLTPQPRKAAIIETRSDSTNPTRFAAGRQELNHATALCATIFPREARDAFSDNQTLNIV